MAQNALPVAIFEGELEKFVMRGYIDGLALPNVSRGKVQYIAEAGHSPQWENPAIFNELLGDFLKTVWV